MSWAGVAGAVRAGPISPYPAPSVHTGPTSNHQHLHFLAWVFSLPTVSILLGQARVLGN